MRAGKTKTTGYRGFCSRINNKVGYHLVALMMRAGRIDRKYQDPYGTGYDKRHCMEGARSTARGHCSELPQAVHCIHIPT